MEKQKANLTKRILAAIIDSFIGWVCALIIPVLGGIVAAIYILLKDALMFQLTKDEQWKRKSIGKKIMGLEVVRLDGADITLEDSARRNIPLTIGSFISIVPLIGWIIGGLVAFALGLLELVLLLGDDQGRRIGDRLADTFVVESSRDDRPIGPTS